MPGAQGLGFDIALLLVTLLVSLTQLLGARLDPTKVPWLRILKRPMLLGGSFRVLLYCVGVTIWVAYGLAITFSVAWVLDNLTIRAIPSAATSDTVPLLGLRLVTHLALPLAAYSYLVRRTDRLVTRSAENLPRSRLAPQTRPSEATDGGSAGSDPAG